MSMLKLGFALVALSAVVWASSYHVEPRQLSPEEYHLVGTVADDGRRFTDIPLPCQVEIPPPEGSLAGSAIGFPFGQDAILGTYDGSTRTIRIESDLLRSLAGLPECMPDQAQDLLIHTIRHEYGHALLEDYYVANTADASVEHARLLAYNDVRSVDPALIPSELKPVAEEYVTLPPETYANPYFMGSFHEFFAESYARFLTGLYVPPATTAFLESLATAERDVR